ncbi:MAG: lysophospholipid acyltransferase family protein [Deltaproteobacteria bacterium]|nr:lysophospholipid acyltransferase family protein [Deltaproteobacteria bacterium]
MGRIDKNGITETKWRLVGLFGKWVIDGLFCCTPVESVGKEKVESILASKRFILALWHSRILLINYLYKGWNGVALVSRSDDGEIMARVIERQGHESIRGSTGKGGLRALSRQIRCLRQMDRPGLVIPDGPQGPRFKVQAGIITLAQKTGCPIIPISYSARKMKIFNSWDRFILPRPLTRCRVVYGDPVSVPGKASREDLERCRQKLENELCRITNEADGYFGHQIT